MNIIKNNTNSPYDLPTLTGSVRLPAFEEVEGEFTDDYVLLLKHSGAVEVLESTKISVKRVAPEPVAEEVAEEDAKEVVISEAEPQAEPQAEAEAEAEKKDDIEDLRKQYFEIFNKKPHHKKSADTLRAEIDQALGE